jgi:molybdenum cofactor cytidylyltransferase
MPTNGGVILLAAGSGSRFGSDKRLHVMPNGDPVLLTTVRRYASIFDQIIVITRPGESHVERMLTEALGRRAPPIVYAADAHLGMGHSLAAGIASVEHWPYAFVALGDMPFVQTTTLATLRATIQANGQEAIVVPTFDGQPGHPVGFDRCYFPEIADLSGDAGARKVVTANSTAVSYCAVDDPGVLRDIDRPEDLANPGDSL